MYIYPNGTTGPLRPDSAAPTSDLSGAIPDVRPVPPMGGGVDRSDKVQISDAGRALSARDTSESGALDPSRTEAIRGRVLSGAYDTLEVVDAVARRLMDSGDL